MGHIRGIKTRVYSFQEGWDLCCAIMRKGYEGVQNDSSRYNDIMLADALTRFDYCWIGVCGTSKNGCLRIVSIHDKQGKKYLKDVGKSKFIETLGLYVKKEILPKSLR